ncbi:uncharacterized protein LOC128234966 isoform X2 [Mya arenaria]|uniref:uncharacterized protein LOC128234966 isoform X2 n=1 Tax=Mya arenaria TaxID=6604 RepID=UPI0022E4E054|nr:uncharacterized protein LOC128234966 isoform X2 [Mya arenaria]
MLSGFGIKAMTYWQGIVIVLVAFIGLSAGLDCIECSWNRENGTVEDGCLAAPYRAPSQPCNTSTDSGQKHFCQTHAKFEVKSGVMSLTSLDRLCDVKHSRCDNECSDKSIDCWSCCLDYNNCNSFPVSVNIVFTSVSSARRPEAIMTLALSATVLSALSTILRLTNDVDAI